MERLTKNTGMPWRAIENATNYYVTGISAARPGRMQSAVRFPLVDCMPPLVGFEGRDDRLKGE